jgi:hypothetical protein
LPRRRAATTCCTRATPTSRSSPSRCSGRTRTTRGCRARVRGERASHLFSAIHVLT